jgi:DNA-binding NarL/FixJ family response regulator
MVKLLLVDDSYLIRNRLVGLLSPLLGVSFVATASYKSEVHELVQRYQPDILVTDLMLVDGSMLDIISQIKQISPRTRTAVLTNHISDVAHRQCVQAGVDWYFDKSTEFEALLHTVKQAIATAHGDNA